MPGTSFDDVLLVNPSQIRPATSDGIALAEAELGVRGVVVADSFDGDELCFDPADPGTPFVYAGGCRRGRALPRGQRRPREDLLPKRSTLSLLRCGASDHPCLLSPACQMRSHRPGNASPSALIAAMRL